MRKFFFTYTRKGRLAYIYRTCIMIGLTKHSLKSNTLKKIENSSLTFLLNVWMGFPQVHCNTPRNESHSKANEGIFSSSVHCACTALLSVIPVFFSFSRIYLSFNTRLSFSKCSELFSLFCELSIISSLSSATELHESLSFSTIAASLSSISVSCCFSVSCAVESFAIFYWKGFLTK